MKWRENLVGRNEDIAETLKTAGSEYRLRDMNGNVWLTLAKNWHRRDKTDGFVVHPRPTDDGRNRLLLDECDVVMSAGSIHGSCPFNYSITRLVTAADKAPLSWRSVVIFDTPYWAVAISQNQYLRRSVTSSLWSPQDTF